MPPLGKLPIVHVPEPPDDPELPEMPDEPELEDEDPEPELDELELELLPELELELELETEAPELEPDELELELERPPEPEFEAEVGPALEPLDPEVEPDEPSPALAPVLPSSPVQPLLSLADEHDASRAMTPGRTRCERALMARLLWVQWVSACGSFTRIVDRAPWPVLATNITPSCRKSSPRPRADVEMSGCPSRLRARSASFSGAHRAERLMRK